MNKASGSDKMSPKVLNDLAEDVGPHLTSIFTSLETMHHRLCNNGHYSVEIMLTHPSHSSLKMSGNCNCSIPYGQLLILSSKLSYRSVVDAIIC